MAIRSDRASISSSLLIAHTGDRMSATIHDPGSAAVPEDDERDWLAIGMGLSGLLSIVALVIAIAALASGAGGSSMSGMAMTPATGASAGASAGAATGLASTAPIARTVKMTFKSDVEHGKRGPDRTWHDAAVPAIFSVHAGAKVTVIAYNYDVAPHSFTDPTLGVNKMLPKGTRSHPTESKFTFIAPSQPGRYPWWCVFPCDPFAMSHDGYMRGYVTVTA
jgi:hypothetical protein